MYIAVYNVMIKRFFFLIFAIAVLLSACSNDDSFSTSRNNVLTFSVDTVEMDTLFSTVPSSTYGFTVRNLSGDGIRIQTVRLERGGQSGFRVNVDGTYVDPVANGLEVRKGDSLFVFVEATTRMNGQDGPELVEDNLIFTLESGVVQKLNLRTWSWDAEKIMSLNIQRDTTIESDRPVIIYDRIVVDSGAVLTLRNTAFYFHDGAQLFVRGTLLANGCLFRGDRLDHMFNYLPYDRISGQWDGIHLVNPSRGNLLTGCEIRNASTAILADSTELVMQDCVVHNCSGFGIEGWNADIMLDYCQVTNCGADCLLADGGIVSINHSTIAQFYPYSAQRGAALNFTTGRRGILLDCRNTLVTGYKDDVVMGERIDTTLVYDFKFMNCLLRTDSVTSSDYVKDIIWETPKDSVEGKKHFRMIDEKNFIYDFRLDSISPALPRGIGRIIPE